MVERDFWRQRIEAAWAEAPIVWLSGVLGSGKTTLAESHVRALEITHAITVVRLFHGGGRAEILRQPKIYGFDTGFVSFARGWNPLRPDDLGVLWEHLVLEHLASRFPDRPPLYWRDKRGHEMDFVIVRDRDAVDAIECKWDPSAFDPRALAAFRDSHPRGRNLLVSPAAGLSHDRRFGNLLVTVCTPDGIVA